MNYKKIFKSQKLRFKILNFLSWVPDKIMVKIQYRIKTGNKLNLKNPQRYTEKLQWYKLYYRNPLMHQCVDKYEVRNYIESIGLKEILNELYGVYDCVDDIKFDDLPNQFVIKTTNGGGGQNIIFCKDKKVFNVDNSKNLLKLWLKSNPEKSFGREWAYDGNNNKIIIEKYLEDSSLNMSGVSDYKFFCYNGRVEFIVFDGDRYVKHVRAFYDRNWNFLDVVSDCLKCTNDIIKPDNLNDMIKIAEKISESFPFVRVDLYNINSNKIVFGEMTFYPWSGYVNFEPDNFDFVLGEKWNYEK